ncbi:hypothetical protein SAMN05428975_4802 [Mucilaginibacter sp. OK268]|uniref:immunity protein Imm33 domain-containing protein n=1 Tax=Mucilaginibacter sp. OK268 TaxID=1881048 RepID=UPI00088DA463|nr:hypothetical protein [Mucilaginibacter sp. OK268]SDP98798.1 hypothetical protein SAMN05428975_4802 [Mucilaginibacter sp. OK268]
MTSLDMRIIRIFMREKKMMDCKTEQMAICEKYGSPYYESLPISKIGVAKNLKDGIWPINGLRHPHEGDTTGWYIWAGENFSSDPDFFEPVHVIHIIESFPIIAKYLGLASGTRSVNNGYLRRCLGRSNFASYLSILSTLSHHLHIRTSAYLHINLPHHLYICIFVHPHIRLYFPKVRAVAAFFKYTA